MKASTDYSRRTFLAGGMMAAAGVAAAGMLAGCSSEQEPLANTGADSGIPSSWDYEVDVAIAGGGYAGLTAGATAVENGATSVLVEASKRCGGSGLAATIGFGFLKYTSLDNLLAANPTANKEMATLLWETFEELKGWFREINVPYSESEMFPNYILLDPMSREGNIAIADKLREAYEAGGGVVETEAKVVRLYQDANDNVIGFKAVRADGTPLNVKAKSVILSNGGFQNNPQMKQQYLGKNADLIQNQGCTYNDGSGIRMGLSAGGVLSRDMDTFSGIPQAYPPIIPLTDEEWEECQGDIDLLTKFNEACTGLQLGQSILLNLNGRRFADESLGEMMTQKGIVEQPYCRALFIMDSDMRAEVYASAGRTGLEAERDQDVLDYVAEAGAHIYSGDTIEELAANIAAGTDLRPTTDEPFSMSHLEANAAAIVETVNEYNAACDAGTTALLNPPRLYDARKIEKAPFYAVEATAGTYLTCGGLKVNQRFQVLGNCDVPVQGLFAACSTAGGIMGKVHWTILAHHFGSGRVVGKSAAEYALGIEA